jgi:hypothetical protein
MVFFVKNTSIKLSKIFFLMSNFQNSFKQNEPDFNCLSYSNNIQLAIICFTDRLAKLYDVLNAH